MGRLRLDQQVMTGWIMLFANGRPPAVGGSDIDHRTDFELTTRQPPKGAVCGHAVERDDFRWLGNKDFRWLGHKDFRWLGHMAGRGWGAKDAGDQLFERQRRNLSAYMFTPTF